MSWDPLTRELDRWADSGRIASFWWRDDDAEAPSPELDRLLDLALGHGLAPAVAVIPAGLDPALAPALARHPGIAALQHGYSHQNHVPAEAKKTELALNRPIEAITAELVRGRDRLRQLFGERFLPVLVPPWNRIAPQLIPALPSLGYLGLSTYGGRPAAAPTLPLLRVNTHIDPVDWSGRRFLGLAPAVGLATRHLAARRQGRLDPSEPTGLLTHHRMHDLETWGFLTGFFERTSRHPAVSWLGPWQAFNAEARVLVA